MKIGFIQVTTSAKILYWTPRAICILAIAFISMFALDSFEPGVKLRIQLLHFFAHLVPSYILIALLVIAWKWERVGGLLFLLIGAVFTPLIFLMNYHRLLHYHGRAEALWMSLFIVLVITVPFIVTGVLFLISSIKNRTHLVK